MNVVSLLFSKLIPLGCGMDNILIRHIFSVDTIFDMASVIFAEEMSQDLSRLSLSSQSSHVYVFKDPTQG